MVRTVEGIGPEPLVGLWLELMDFAVGLEGEGA